MSSEMREYVAALRDREHRFHGMGGQYVAEVIRGELEDILALTEAGPSLLCQSGACANKGTAHNFCTPRTEAGADGAVSMNPIGYVDLASWQADWNASESFFTDYQDEDTQPIYTQAQMEHAIEIAKVTHPQDASGDAEVLTAHGIKALDRCCGELRNFIELAEDYDLDEMAVQALQTAIESMEMRKANAMQAKEAK